MFLFAIKTTVNNIPQKNPFDINFPSQICLFSFPNLPILPGSIQRENYRESASIKCEDLAGFNFDSNRRPRAEVGGRDRSPLFFKGTGTGARKNLYAVIEPVPEKNYLLKSKPEPISDSGSGFHSGSGPVTSPFHSCVPLIPRTPPSAKNNQSRSENYILGKAGVFKNFWLEQALETSKSYLPELESRNIIYWSSGHR